jgi:hypothetical protein
MTEYELQELAFMANGLAATYITILITIISGYLLVAYVAGAKLSKPQVMLVNTLFVFASALFTYGMLASFIKQQEIVTHLQSISPEAYHAVNQFVISALTGVFTIIILASLHFMWGVRHPKTE